MFNILVIGESKVGKYAYIERLMSFGFIINVNFISERRRFNCYSYDDGFSCYDAVIIMYDLTNIKSFRYAHTMIDKINVPFIICANKSDMINNTLCLSDVRVILGEMMKKHIIISVKKNINIKESIILLTDQL